MSLRFLRTNLATNSDFSKTAGVVEVDRKLSTAMQLVADERAAQWWKG